MLSITWTKKNKKNKNTQRKVKRRIQSYNILYPLYGLGCFVAFLLVITTYIYFDIWMFETQKWALKQTQRMGFSLEDVVVVGRHRTSKEEILSHLALTPQSPLYSFNPSELKNKLEDLPWVEAAFVKRTPPHTLFIDLKENVPIALWQYKGKHQLIDRNGNIIEGQDPRPFRHLTKIIGKEAPGYSARIVQALSRYPKLQSRTTALTHQHGQRWDMRLGDRTDVKLPETHLDEAFQKLTELDREHDFSRGEIMVIDMRFPDKLILRLAPEATQKGLISGQDA